MCNMNAQAKLCSRCCLISAAENIYSSNPTSIAFFFSFSTAVLLKYLSAYMALSSRLQSPTRNLEAVPAPFSSALLPTQCQASPPTPAAEASVPYTTFTRHHKRLVTIILTLAMLASPLTATIYFPLLPLLATEFRVSIQAINLTITLYIVFQATSSSSSQPLLTISTADQLTL